MNPFVGTSSISATKPLNRPGRLLRGVQSNLPKMALTTLSKSLPKGITSRKCKHESYNRTIQFGDNDQPPVVKHQVVFWNRCHHRRSVPITHRRSIQCAFTCTEPVIHSSVHNLCKFHRDLGVGCLSSVFEQQP